MSDEKTETQLLKDELKDVFYDVYETIQKIKDSLDKISSETVKKLDNIINRLGGSDENEKN